MLSEIKQCQTEVSWIQWLVGAVSYLWASKSASHLHFPVSLFFPRGGNVSCSLRHKYQWMSSFACLCSCQGAFLFSFTWLYAVFLHSVQVDLKTVLLLLTQKDISNLFNYRVAENRFCVINLISGIVKISSLNNERWKSHNVRDSRTGTTISVRHKQTFLSSLVWTHKSYHVQSRCMVSLF